RALSGPAPAGSVAGRRGHPPVRGQRVGRAVLLRVLGHRRADGGLLGRRGPAAEARRPTSDAPLLAGLALALGGLGRYAWPEDGRRRWRDLAAGVAGVAVAALAGGALAGVVLPILSMAAALLIGRRLVVGEPAVTDGTAPLAAPGVGPDIAADAPLGASAFRPGRRGFVALLVLILFALGLGLAGFGRFVAGKYSW